MTTNSQIADLRARAMSAADLALALARLADALEATGLPDDAQCAEAVRGIDAATLLALPGEQALDILQRLGAAIYTLQAWKLAR